MYTQNNDTYKTALCLHSDEPRLITEAVYKYLTFNVERLIINEGTVEMVNCGAEEWLKQFDKIIFTTKDGKQTSFKREVSKV